MLTRVNFFGFMVFRLQREREGHGDACRACGMLIFLRLSTKTRRSGDHVWCRTRNAVYTDFDDTFFYKKDALPIRNAVKTKNIEIVFCLNNSI